MANEQQTFEGIFTQDIRLASGMVQTTNGDKPIFVIEWHTVKADGTQLPPQSFVMTPDQLGYLSDRLLEAAQQHGIRPAKQV